MASPILNMQLGTVKCNLKTQFLNKGLFLLDVAFEGELYSSLACKRKAGICPDGWMV